MTGCLPNDSVATDGDVSEGGRRTCHRLAWWKVPLCHVRRNLPASQIDPWRPGKRAAPQFSNSRGWLFLWPA